VWIDEMKALVISFPDFKASRPWARLKLPGASQACG
jgi:hypothetical protein